jgi:hypothetical protein
MRSRSAVPWQTCRLRRSRRHLYRCRLQAEDACPAELERTSDIGRAHEHLAEVGIPIEYSDYPGSSRRRAILPLGKINSQQAQGRSGLTVHRPAGRPVGPLEEILRGIGSGLLYPRARTQYIHSSAHVGDAVRGYGL